MTRADDIVRRRADRAAEADAAARAVARDAYVARRLPLIDEIQADAGELIDLLGQHDFPEAVLIRVATKSFFGRVREVRRAAWRVCDYTVRRHGDDVTATVYFLTDRTFAAGVVGLGLLDLSDALESEVKRAESTEFRLEPGVGIRISAVAHGMRELLARFSAELPA